jgi:hypothetical protein
MSHAWPLVLVLTTASVQAGPLDGKTCPPDGDVRRALGVERATAPVTCRIVEHAALMAAVVPASGGAAPHVVVKLSWDTGSLSGQIDLPRMAAWHMPASAAASKIDVAPANLKGADWWRVDVTATAQEDPAMAQTMVSFFKTHSRKLRRLWTGLGDRHEARNGCRLDTVADFAILDTWALVRGKRTTRALAEQTASAAGAAATPSTRCLATPPTRQTFAVADDGVDADFPLSDELVTQARENHLLSLRARTSTEALGLFVTNSLAILPQVELAVMNAGSGVSMTTSGADAFMMDSSGGSGLNWTNILSIVDPTALPLARALAELRNGDGAWSSPASDYGGCHHPEDATEPLRHVTTAWRATSPAIRRAFEPVLAADLREMSEDACFCVGPDKRSELQRALDRNAAIVKDLPGGDRTARALRALPSDKYVRFNCSPG